jgi:hypothetical protein
MMAPAPPRAGAISLTLAAGHWGQIPPGPGFCLERTRQERVIQHAENQANYRPNENAAPSARLDSDDTNDAHGRKGDEGATTRANANKDGSSSRREGENHAAGFVAETAGSSEGINPW